MRHAIVEQVVSMYTVRSGLDTLCGIRNTLSITCSCGNVVRQQQHMRTLDISSCDTRSFTVRAVACSTMVQGCGDVP